MVGGIARAANLVEKLIDLPRKDAVITQAAQKFVLSLLGLLIDAYGGGDELGEHLRKLPQLKQASGGKSSYSDDRHDLCECH
jgi:hypothetical protein